MCPVIQPHLCLFPAIIIITIAAATAAAAVGKIRSDCSSGQSVSVDPATESEETLSRPGICAYTQKSNDATDHHNNTINITTTITRSLVEFRVNLSWGISMIRE